MVVIWLNTRYSGHDMILGCNVEEENGLSSRTTYLIFTQFKSIIRNHVKASKPHFTHPYYKVLVTYHEEIEFITSHPAIPLQIR